MARKQRFRYAVIIERIEKARSRLGLSTRELAARAGLEGSAWYRKMRQTGSSFTLEEFGRIADALDAPEGWPFVEWR